MFGRLGVTGKLEYRFLLTGLPVKDDTLPVSHSVKVPVIDHCAAEIPLNTGILNKYMNTVPYCRNTEQGL